MRSLIICLKSPLHCKLSTWAYRHHTTKCRQLSNQHNEDQLNHLLFPTWFSSSAPHFYTANSKINRHSNRSPTPHLQCRQSSQSCYSRTTSQLLICITASLNTGCGERNRTHRYDTLACSGQEAAQLNLCFKAIDLLLYFHLRTNSCC